MDKVIREKVRPVLIKAWRGDWPTADEFIALSELVDMKALVEVLSLLNDREITVNEAEEELVKAK